MSKKLILAFLCAALFAFSSCRTDRIDLNRGMEAGRDFYNAATITDAELVSMSSDMRALDDKRNNVPPSGSKYDKRLQSLTSKLKNEDGLNLNFKVYVTSDVNANATADGSIRVFSGMMDLMTDDELFFIIGHEIGHVKDGDSLDKIRTAYTTSGARKAAGAGDYRAAILSESALGALLETVVNAQFSQKQENDADTYGYDLMKKYGRNPQAAVSALKKLASLGASGGPISSHPNFDDRAKHIADLIAKDK